KGFGLDAGPGLAAWRTGALDITTAAAPGLGGRGARWVLLAHTGLAAAGELTDTDDAAIAELFALAAAAAIAPKGVHLRLHTAHAQAATAAARARTGRGALLQRLAREKRARSRAAGLVIAHDAHAPLL